MTVTPSLMPMRSGKGSKNTAGKKKEGEKGVERGELSRTEANAKKDRESKKGEEVWGTEACLRIKNICVLRTVAGP